jgi:hypothetical protein
MGSRCTGPANPSTLGTLVSGVKSLGQQRDVSLGLRSRARSPMVALGVDRVMDHRA